MEMSSQEQNAQASGTQTEVADSAAPAPAQTTAAAPAQNAAGTGTVDEAAAQKIALEHAGVKAADATITKSKLDYEDGHPEYEGKIIYGGTEYEFTIDAATGSVMEWDAEKVR